MPWDSIVISRDALTPGDPQLPAALCPEARVQEEGFAGMGVAAVTAFGPDGLPFLALFDQGGELLLES
jgi:hypothetical protein